MVVYKAYIAGLIDLGASFRKRDRYQAGDHWKEYRLRLLVPDQTIGAAIAEQFGGMLKKHAGGWHIDFHTRNKALILLECALPYLRTKRKQAEEWLDCA